jgi:hypothetical protein
MWSRQAWVPTGGVINVTEIVKSLSRYNTAESLLDPDLEVELMTKIIEVFDADTICSVLTALNK